MKRLSVVGESKAYLRRFAIKNERRVRGERSNIFMSKYSLENFGYIANKEAVDLGFDVLSRQSNFVKCRTTGKLRLKVKLKTLFRSSFVCIEEGFLSKHFGQHRI